ncbi:hypothetical protein Hte_000403 [Hypoxylon texense]
MASTDRPTSLKLYFAFGSNMRLQQMAERCPRSSLYARGRLCHYRWQINHRGVANIVKSGPEDVVEGLLFSITRRDEIALDRNEGVARGLYNKEYLRVEVEPLLVEPSPSVKSDIAATAAWLKQHTQSKAQSSPLPPPKPAISPPSTSCGSGQPPPPGPMASSIQSSEAVSDESRSTERRVVDALVYVSNHTQDGEIRSEYVPRMHSAMSDAEELGVLVCARLFLREPRNPPQSSRKQQRTESLSPASTQWPLVADVTIVMERLDEEIPDMHRMDATLPGVSINGGVDTGGRGVECPEATLARQSILKIL